MPPGAVMGNDISGFADPELPGRGRRGRGHGGGHPHPARSPHPRPRAGLRRRGGGGRATFLLERAAWATRPACHPDRIVLDAGLDLGKTAEQSLDPAPGLGPARRARVPAAPVGVQQDVPRRRCSDLEIGERREASLAATALGAALGCRIMRVHEVGRPPAGLCRARGSRGGPSVRHARVGPMSPRARPR